MSEQIKRRGSMGAPWCAAVLVVCGGVAEEVWGGPPEIMWQNAGNSGVYSIAVSRDERLIAVGGEFTAKVYDAVTGGWITTLEGHRSPVTGVYFSRDGERLFTASGGYSAKGPAVESSLRTWSTLNWAPMHQSTAPEIFTIMSIGVTGDEAYVVGSFDACYLCGTHFQAWRAGDLSTAGSVDDGPFERCMAVSPTEHVVAQPGYLPAHGSYGINFLSVPAGEVVGAWPMAEAPTALAYSPDGTMLVAGGGWEQGFLETRRVSDGAVVRQFKEVPRAVDRAAFSPDGRRLATTRALFWPELTAGVDIWSMDDGERLRTVAETEAAWWAAPVFLSDSRRVLVGAMDGVAKVIDTGTGETTLRIAGEHGGQVLGVAFSPDGKFMASTDHRGRVVVWDLPAMTVRFGFSAMHFAWEATFSSNGLLAVREGERLGVYDVEDGSLVLGVPAPTAQPLAFDMTADGGLIATNTGNQGDIEVRRLPDGEVLRRLWAVGQPVYGIRFSPDGDSVLVSSGSFIRVWRLADGTMERTIATPPRGRTFEISPDGEMIAVSTLSDVRLLRYADGALVRTISSAASSFQFDASGEVLLTGGVSGTISMWRVADGALLARYDRETGARVHGVAFSARSRMFAYGRGDATVVLARNPFAPCRADFDEDGVVGTGDFFGFVDAFLREYPLADENGDGRVNSQDFFDFLAAFFGGCGG